MTKSIRLFAHILVGLLLLPSIIYGAEPLKDPFYTQGQQIYSPPPLYSVQESVDHFSGNLKLAHTDVFLPGNGGLDLTIMRTYSSAIWGKRSPWVFVAEKERSPLGIGWTMHMGIVRNPFGTGLDSLYLGDNPVVEMPDGSQHFFYKVPNQMNVFVSKDNWIYKLISVSGIWELTLTDGTVYTFEFNPATIGHYAFDGTAIAVVTKIQNAAKNSTITLTYDRKLAPDGAVYSYLKTIKDSADRTITFNYDSAKHQLNSISIGYTTLVSYTYQTITGPAGTFNFLTRAKLPEGSTSATGNWNYSYSSTNYELQTLTFPQGGAITYEFSDIEFYAAPASYVYFSVLTKRTTSGNYITSGVWSYQYATGGTSGNITTVTAPNGMKEVYKYNAWGNSTSGNVWKVGLPISKEIYSGTSPVYKEDYGWTIEIDKPGSSPS